MRRALACVLALLVPSAPASAAQYGWSISASDIDPHVHTGGNATGFGHLYLWYECNLDAGLSSVDLSLAAVGVAVVGFTPLNGFVNAGSATHLLLAVASCPNAPVLAGQIPVIFSGVPASLCIDPGGIAVDCIPSVWPIYTVGWDALSPPSCDERVPDGLLCAPYCHQDICHPDLGCIPGICVRCGSCTPCDASCPPVAVQPTPWGSVKALYR